MKGNTGRHVSTQPHERDSLGEVQVKTFFTILYLTLLFTADGQFRLEPEGGIERTIHSVTPGLLLNRSR